MEQEIIRYRFRHVDKSGEVWLSPDTFEAPSLRHIRQAIIGGYIMGSEYSAVTETGKLIFGLDAKGKAL